jgi:hypothetical protein
MGAQASVMRAAIAPLAPASQRGTAYGIFNAAYGLAWFAGSSLLGALYWVRAGARRCLRRAARRRLGDPVAGLMVNARPAKDLITIAGSASRAGAWGKSRALADGT